MPGGVVVFSVKDYSCRKECYRCSMPPCSDERRDLWLCCYPQGPLLDVYRTRSMFKQLLVGLSIPLQDAVLSSPVPRISQQAGAPFRGTSPLNSVLHNAASPSPQQTCNIAQRACICFLEESCRIYQLLGRSFGVLHCIPAITRCSHSCFLLYSSAKTYSEGSALPGIT